MDNTFAFIGAGNMGGAVVEAVCRGVNPRHVIIYDRDTAKTAALSEKTGCTVAEDAKAAAAGGHFVFMCVKPDVLPAALQEISPALKAAADRHVVVSIAAGVTKAAIKALLAEAGLALPLVRLLPNTPVAVGRGLIIAAPDESLPETELAALLGALAPGGAAELLDEACFDAATPVFSCSPAFTYMYIEALADGGVLAGLPRDKAQRFAAQAVLGAAAMVLETGRHPGELKDAVCSPGGSTIAGVEALERGAFRADVAAAVAEAYEKTARLGK
ncbi:MAG: pyrroline-5-carboxylate reductase [Oscillospiraceae bacterium]|nr:pyrroline-5-carboxylate reductase [Oscillospiraceae bacterium]